MAHFAELESNTDPTGFTSDTHLIVKRWYSFMEAQIGAFRLTR